MPRQIIERAPLAFLTFLLATQLLAQEVYLVTSDTGGGASIARKFSTLTTDADPGNGYVRFNSATPSAVTFLYADNADAEGNSITVSLDAWDDATTASRTELVIGSVTNNQQWVSFRVNGAITDGTGYRKIPVTYIAGGSTFPNDTQLAMRFSPGTVPADASYIVGAAHGELFGERVLTDTATVTWDLSVPGQAKATAVGGGGYTDEQAQDATGAMLANSPRIALVYVDVAPSLTADIVPDSVTYAFLQNVSATDRLLGRSTAGAGDIEEIACTAAGRAIIDDADASAQRTTLGLGTLATQSGTFSGTSSGTNTGDQTITLTGDVTGTGTGSFAATIAADSVTLAKMADMATDSILGRDTAATGNPEVLTITQVLDFADATRGTVLSRGASAWVGIDPGTATHVLTSNGPGADPTYQAAPGGPTIISGSSGAASGSVGGTTWHRLSANATANSTTSLAVVMTTTGLVAGTYWYEYTVLWQSATATVGVNFAVDYTGTNSKNIARRMESTTGAAAATGVADMVAAVLSGSLVEAAATRTDGGSLGPTTGVDTTNADQMTTIRGILVATGSGQLELEHASETATSTQVMAETSLKLERVN